MIFYIEGPDHSGKTTLANYLIESRKANYVHCTYDKDWNLEKYHHEIGDMVEKLNSYKQDIVLDRWCLSHYAYRLVNKENSYNPQNLWNKFVTKINSKQLVVIYCVPAGEFNPEERFEMFSKNEVSQVENEYNDLFSQIPHYTYYYKTDGKDMPKFIQNCIKMQQSDLRFDYHWITDKIEFPNYGNEENNYFKQEKKLTEEEKDAIAYSKYLEQFYKDQKIMEEEMEKAINKLETPIKNLTVRTVKYKDKNYTIKIYKDQFNNEEICIRPTLGKHGENEDKKVEIKSDTELFKEILNELNKEETVDEKLINYDNIPYTIACDFDETLVKNAFPKIIAKDENINWDLVNKLKDEVKSGKKLVLFTNRTGQALDDAVTFCNDVLGLVFDAVNDNIQEVKDLGLDPRKIWYNVLFDDKSITIKF